MYWVRRRDTSVSGWVQWTSSVVVVWPLKMGFPSQSTARDLGVRVNVSAKAGAVNSPGHDKPLHMLPVAGMFAIQQLRANRPDRKAGGHFADVLLADSVQFPQEGPLAAIAFVEGQPLQEQTQDQEILT